jgi:hypothetical protein
LVVAVAGLLRHQQVLLLLVEGRYLEVVAGALLRLLVIPLLADLLFMRGAVVEHFQARVILAAQVARQLF